MTNRVVGFNSLASDPNSGKLVNHTEKELLVKILAELRVLTMIIHQESSCKDDLGALRNEAMLYGRQTLTDL